MENDIKVTFKNESIYNAWCLLRTIYPVKRLKDVGFESPRVCYINQISQDI